jgi:hypothetical protein
MYLLLLFGTTAKEFIHMFSGHEDTVHREHAPGEISFESEHHHCEFLSYSLPAFDNDISLPSIIYAGQTMEAEYQSAAVRFVQREVIQTSLRGPPAVTV